VHLTVEVENVAVNATWYFVIFMRRPTKCSGESCFPLIHPAVTYIQPLFVHLLSISHGATSLYLF